MKKEFGEYLVDTGELYSDEAERISVNIDSDYPLKIEGMKTPLDSPSGGQVLNLKIELSTTSFLPLTSKYEFLWRSADAAQFYAELLILIELLQSELMQSQNDEKQKVSWWRRFFDKKYRYINLGVLGDWEVQIALGPDSTSVSIGDSPFFPADALIMLANRIQPGNSVG
jgi:hypothetical protein